MVPIVLPRERLARSGEVLTTLLSNVKDTKKKVEHVQDVNDDKDEYAFIVKSTSQPGKIKLVIY